MCLPSREPGPRRTPRLRLYELGADPLALASHLNSDLNSLVANYLFTEGYLSAAENFAREAGLDTTATAATSSSLNGASSTAASTPSYDVESIKTRMEVRRAVLKGDVEVALDKVVDLDLEVSASFPCLRTRRATEAGERFPPMIDHELCTTLS